jgi:hypothetical protein
MKLLITVAVICASTLTACDTTNAKKVDADYGKSVATLVRAQTYDPEVAAAPAPLAPEHGDGQRLKNAVDEYHKDVPRQDEKISRPIVFEVGNK